MKIIQSTISFQDSQFKKIHTFSEGYSVPIFDVFSFNGLNQVIGYAKYTLMNMMKMQIIQNLLNCYKI